MKKDSKWILKNNKADLNKISQKYGISPMLAKIIINKGIKEEELFDYLNSEDFTFYDHNLINNIKDATLLCIKHIKANNKIRIIGDYDVDGIMACFILVSAFKELNCNISYEIPHRINDGYGINENIVKKAADDGINLIITCDNGISAFSAVELAKQCNIDIIITDHHSIKKDNDNEILPAADYIINPHLKDCEYPFKTICGAYVAYKFILSLYENYNKKIDISLNNNCITAAALATICDVMPLKDENRALVHKGLELLKTTDNIGLRCLIEANNINISEISSYHIGFIIGPSLNASGRLKSANIALKLLFTKDLKDARERALNLIEINNERKELTSVATSKAIELIEKEFINDKILIIYLEDVHESIAGIIAGRVKEYFNKPVIVLTSSDKDIAKGSGRSTDSYNMIEELQKHDSIFIKYGGHKMAAGMSLYKNNIEKLRTVLNDACTLSDLDFINTKYIDIHLPFKYIDFKFINELSKLEPFGNGNEKPIFAHNKIKILNYKIYGQNNNVVKLKLNDEYKTIIDAIYFDNDEIFANEILYNDMYKNSELSILYYPKINTFNNISNIQIIINDYKYK